MLISIIEQKCPRRHYDVTDKFSRVVNPSSVDMAFHQRNVNSRVWGNTGNELSRSFLFCMQKSSSFMHCKLNEIMQKLIVYTYMYV